MSFLNPVNEPVLRFKSTDAGAPQINYNARVAGDVKAVLKACLVTGYGATASAGWTAVNEASHVIEFVSPSAAMSDYRLAVDDTATTGTVWYYNHQGARINPTDNTITKNITNINKTSPENGWDLIVTDQGFYFIERFYHTMVSAIQARLTSFGRVKSALTDGSDTHNMGFWCTGHQAPTIYSWQFFPASAVTKRYYNINGYIKPLFASANIDLMAAYPFGVGLSVVDMSSELYLVQDGVLLGQHVGILLTVVNDAIKKYGVYETTINTRPVLYVSLGVAVSTLDTVQKGTRGALIYLDSWEY